MPLTINILTIFSQFFETPLSLSILGRAREKRLVEYRVIDLRAFATDDHRTVDDYPYGGGPGMVLKPEPIFRAVESLGVKESILLSPRGQIFTHEKAVELSVRETLTFICGHYKDVDARVAQHLATEEISVGDFVLSGGEIACLAIIDAVVRLLPGALGDFDSATGDSFFEGLLGAPMYTRPAEFGGLKVPEVLVSGDHAKIQAWRREEALRFTRERRPDLYAAWQARQQSTVKVKPI